jgi:hypothetical protein
MHAGQDRRDRRRVHGEMLARVRRNGVIPASFRAASTPRQPASDSGRPARPASPSDVRSHCPRE